MSNITSFSDDLATALDAAAPSLVRIQSGRRVGTGLVWSADGLILTVASALSRSGRTAVTLHDGTTHIASVVGSDRGSDVALLTIDAEGLTPAAFGDPELRAGNLVILLGRPGRNIRPVLGLVSGVSGSWTSRFGGSFDRFIDVEASLPGGFGGGPLLAADGTVVGLNSRHVVRGGTTIPSKTLTRLVEALQTGGVPRGWLGVAFQNVDLDGADFEAAGVEEALLVTGVRAGSPADGGGVRLGDALLTLGGDPIGRPEQLAAALSARVGAEATLSVLRGGAVVELTVTPGERKRRSA